MTTRKRPKYGRICQACNRDMLNSEGCVQRAGTVTINEEWQWIADRWARQGHPPPEKPEGRCWDCGATPTGYHHPYCCRGSCMIHQSQRLQCGCDRA